ncbi:CPBP family intramembrane glutamic endopeptidase [Bacillus infantis]|uniref:CPBP family intramembrane glutamic endopeptidase n=1 Tax=Bacillus infantis TaxID=324767 RepID=UPI003CF88D10
MMTEFYIFWLASVFGAILVIPYQTKILHGRILEAAEKQPKKKLPPLPVLALIGAVQTGVLLGAASFTGTYLAPKTDLQWPLLDYYLYGTRISFSIWPVMLLSILGGAASALAILLLDRIFSKKMPQAEAETPTRKQAFLASFYGGISEEVLMRLFLMTLVVYMLSFLSSGGWIYWTGIILAAFLFGAGHLPASYQIYGKSLIVTLRTILLNMVPGILFGYLYWKYGIEMAMLSHFCADIVLHVILAPLAANSRKQ